MKEENIITMRKNGTTFTIVLKAADGAKMTFEEMMRKMIDEEAVGMKLEGELDRRFNRQEGFIGVSFKQGNSELKLHKK